MGKRVWIMHRIPGSFWLSLVAALACGLLTGHAAISVGPAGSGLWTFDALPMPSEWSSYSVPGSSQSVRDGAAMDAMVQTNSAFNITNPVTAFAGSPPQAMAQAQWSSTGYYLQTRPAGNTATLLMATLRNDTDNDIHSLRISYDFGLSFPTIEEIWGQRLYYSLTGGPQSWLFVLQTSETGPVSTSIDLSFSPWPPGSSLFLLWADDSGSGSPDTPYSIDNFTAGPPLPPRVLIAQTNGQSYPLGRSFQIDAVAQLDGTATNVLFYENGNLLGADGTMPFNVVFSNATLGAHDLTTVGQDNLGHSVTSAVVRIFVVPNLLPSVTIDFPANGERIPIGAYDICSFSASDPDGTVAVANWEAWLDGTKRLSFSNAFHSFGLPDLTAGLHEISVMVADQEGYRATNTINIIVTNPPGYTFLVTNGASWRFRDDGSDQDTDWRAPEFDDSTWKIGRGRFGSAWGFLPSDTLINRGPGFGSNYVTTYFRHAFTVDDPSRFTSLLLRYQPDDGAVVYLNGIEVFRYNLSAGVINYTTLATNAEAGTFFVNANISPARLVPGRNVLAAEVHVRSVYEFSVSFDLMLWAQPDILPPGPVLAIARGGAGQAIISWTPVFPPPSYTLQYSDSLQSTNWRSAPSGSSNPATISTTNRSRFYRLLPIGVPSQ
jgi:hypothetical protein